MSVFLSSSADLLHAEPRDSMNSRKQKSSTHSLFECKLVVKENAHLKRKRQTFEPRTKILRMIIRLRKKHVLHSFICMCQRSCLQHRMWRRTFEFRESSGKLGLNWQIEHTLMKEKWCNFLILHLVVLYMIYVNINCIYQSVYLRIVRWVLQH